MILSNITASSLNTYRSLKVTETKLDIKNWIVISSISIAFAIVIMNYTLGKCVASTLTYVVLGTPMIIFIYFTLLFAFKAVSIKDFSNN